MSQWEEDGARYGYDVRLIEEMFNTPTMEIPVPTIEEVGLKDYENLLDERQNLKQLQEDCKTRVSQIDEQLGQVLDQKELKTVVYKDYLVIRRQASKPRPILDRVLLLESGVTPQQLSAGTKFGEAGKPGITIRHLSEAKAYEDSTKRDIHSSQVFATEKLD